MVFEKNADHSISWNENIYAEVVTAAGVYQSQRIKQKILDPCLALGLQVYVASTHFCKPIGTQWVIWSIAHWLLPLSQDPFSWYLVWTGSNWEQRSIFFLKFCSNGLSNPWLLYSQASRTATMLMRFPNKQHKPVRRPLAIRFVATSLMVLWDAPEDLTLATRQALFNNVLREQQ